MFKRLFYLITGAGFGFGCSFWLMRTVRQTVDRFRPTNLRSNATGSVSRAVAEGRTAMQQREAELRGRAQLATPSKRRAITTGRQ